MIILKYVLWGIVACLGVIPFGALFKAFGNYALMFYFILVQFVCVGIIVSAIKSEKAKHNGASNEKDNSIIS